MNHIIIMSNFIMGRMRRLYFMALPESRQDFKKSRIHYTIGDTAAQTIVQLAGGTFIVALMSYIGISDGNIGIITSIASVAAAFQMLTMGYASRLKKSKLFVCVTVAQKSWLAFIYFIPLFTWKDSSKKAVLILCFFFAHICIQAGTPATVDWIASLVPSKLRGRYFAVKDSIAVFVVVSVMLAAGLIFDFCKKEYILSSFIILGILIAVLTVLNVVAFSRMKEPKTAVVNDQGKELHGKLAKKVQKQMPPIVKGSLWKAAGDAFRDKLFCKAFILNCFWMTAFYIAAPFNASYQIKELALPYTFIMIINFLSNMIRIYITPKAGRLADQKGMAKVLKYSIISMGIYYLIMMFTVPGNSYIFFTVAALFSSVAWSFIGIGLLGVQLEFMSREKRLVQYAILSAISGVYGFLISFLGGKILNYFQQNPLIIGTQRIYGQQILNLLGAISIIGMILYITFAVQNVKVAVDKRDGR